MVLSRSRRCRCPAVDYYTYAPWLSGYLTLRSRAQVSLPLWQHLSHARLELEMKQAPHLEKKWKTMLKKQKKEGVDKSKGLFLPVLIDALFARLSLIPAQGEFRVWRLAFSV